MGIHNQIIPMSRVSQDVPVFYLNPCEIYCTSLSHQIASNSWIYPVFTFLKKLAWHPPKISSKEKIHCKTELNT